MSNVPALSWYGEVTDPTSTITKTTGEGGYGIDYGTNYGSGTTTTTSNAVHEPPIMDGDGVSPQQNPQANARPRIRLPTPKDDLERYRTILGDGSADISLDVWHDGARQPIDTLVDVADRPGHSVLVGEGGRELKTRVEASYDQRAVHLAAQDLVDNNTTYTSNVDTPPTTTESNTALLTLTTTSDFLTRTTWVDTDPLDATSGTLTLRQTAFFVEAENFDRQSGTRGSTGTEDDDFSQQSGRVLEETNDFLEFDFTTNHRIPGENFEWAVRLDGSDTAACDFIVTLEDGTQQTVDSLNTGVGLTLGWQEVGDGAISAGNGWTSGDIPPGTHTLRIECTDGGTASQVTFVDCLAPYDGRFNHDSAGTGNTFDNTTDANDNLADPTLFAPEVQVAFDIVPAPQAVTGIRAEATLSNGASDYTHYLSNDQGANFTSGTGANFETDSLGTTWGPGVTYKAGLSRTGTRTSASPSTGFQATNLQALTLKADLEDMPLVVNRTFDGHLDEILRELAEIGDQLWEYRRASGTESIEWTTPGQRAATRTPNVGDYRATKTVGQVYQKAIVYGQPDTPVRQERFESDHGNAVSLGHDRLQQGSERVTDPDTGQRFRRGSDYTMDYQAGEITVLSGGDMADATTFEIDYNYQAYGEFDDGTASPNVTPRIDLPGLWSNFLCKQAARLIIDEVSTPIHTAEVTLPNDETGWSVVESIDPDVVPTGGNALHTQNVENTPEATVLTLGSRRSLSDVVGDIRAQIGAVSRKA